MARRLAAALLGAAALATGAPSSASAHAGLTGTDPPAGSALGASPTAVKLTFSERPSVSLSSITVTGAHGASFQSGAPQPSPGDPLSLVVALRPVPKGVYTVHWRIDSAIDGHATSGSFTFGVQVSASAVGQRQSTAAAPVSSTLELVARWLLLIGLILVLGAVSGEIGGFGARTLPQAAAGTLIAGVGVLLLAVAQRRSAGRSLASLLATSVGHALIWRGAALALIAIALLLAARFRPARRAAFAAAGLAALTAVAVHVANGHAAAPGSGSSALTVTAQTAHVGVAGIWLGGLLSLLLGTPAGPRADALRRFAVVAAAGLAVVVVTGVVRAFSELPSWDDLWQTGYGRAVAIKLVLVAIIAGIGWRNRTRGIPALAVGDAAPLRRLGGLELVLAAGAVLAAAVLGTFAPPVSGERLVLRGLAASGTDVDHTVRVSLQTVSAEPGANEFRAQVRDFRTGDPIAGAGVRLLFTPLDDPGVASSALPLLPAGTGYSATGDNLRFDGRWAVRVLIHHNGTGLEVPLELDPVGPLQQISIERDPGQPPKYTKLDGNGGFVRISPHPQRAGLSQLFVNLYTVDLGGEEPIRSLVVTLRPGTGPVAQQVVRRLGPGSFVSPVRLAPGRDEIAVVAHTTFGVRLRSVFDLDVPSR